MATKTLTKAEIRDMSPADFMKASSHAYRKLFTYMKPYKWRFVAGMVFGALFGATQGLLVLAIKSVGDHVFPKDAVAHADTLWVTLGLCMAIPLIMALRGLLSYLNSYFMIWVSLHVLDDIRTDVFSKLLGQSMAFFTRAKGGELIQVVFGRTRMAQQALTQVASDIVKQPISIISALGVLFYVDWKFTLASLTLFPLCLLPVMIISKNVRKSGGAEEEEAAGLIVLMQEAFAGIRVVKSHAREDYEKKRFGAASRKTVQNAMQWRIAMEKVGPMVETIASVGISAALFYAWYYDLGAGKFMALNAGLVLLYPPFKQISRLQILMQKCIAATSRVFEIMEREPDVKDAPDAISLERCEGRVQFEDVIFSYREKQEPESTDAPETPEKPGKKPKKAEKKALKGISLDIPAGTSCALVGSSGAGKTTVMSLLLRLWDVHDGRILVDGHDLRALTQNSLREHIAIVTQDTFLFHDTIRKNIRYGRLDATDEEIETAATLAFAHDFIRKMPAGYDSVVGDKGCMLSGGQQQRVSIARALLKNAPILLLDEATSALDSESEQKIQAALENLSQGRTVIAIAHRLSTVLNANQIVVFEKGRIHSRGTHAELYEQSSIYRKLYDLQFYSHITPAETPALAPASAEDAPDPYEINEV